MSVYQLILLFVGGWSAVIWVANMLVYGLPEWME